ncbi:MAG: hypothetical protein MJ132_06545 [Clostridia bacterium]|nr:hypothetical protein [Clostridia bacterium]
MISVLPIKDLELLKSLFQAEDLTWNGNASGVRASDGNETLGYCLFDLTEKGILIRALNPLDDALLADGILRSALHVAAERSAMDARYADTAPERLLKSLGFVLPDEDHRLDIDKLFGGCGCKK